MNYTAMTRLRPASNRISDSYILMSESKSTDSEAYRISTNISSGKVKDPVTGEAHDIDATSDTSGEITVTNPYSAETLVEESNGFEFIGAEPADHEVRRAQKSALGLETVAAHILDFAESKSGTLGNQTLDASEGFDPETDTPYNDPRLKVAEMYDTLQDSGHTDEARYLRLLGNVGHQEEFVDHAREVLDL